MRRIKLRKGKQYFRKERPDCEKEQGTLKMPETQWKLKTALLWKDFSTGVLKKYIF
jgi:hypothetical protein